MPAGGLVTAAIIGGGASLLSSVIPSIAGSIGKKKRLKDNKEYQEFRSLSDTLGKQTESEYTNQLAGSYLDSAEGSSISNSIRNTGDMQRQSIMNSADFAGASDEAKLAGIGQVNQAEGLSLSGLAGNADARRQTLLALRDNNRMRRLQSLSQAFGMGQAIRGQNQLSQNNLSQGMQGASDAFMMSQMYKPQNGQYNMSASQQAGYANASKSMFGAPSNPIG